MGIERLGDKTLAKIHLIPYSHHDYEWCCTRDWHKWRYIKCYCDVLDELNQNPAFKWCIDNVIHSLIPFLEYCPQRADEFADRVKEGRICVVNGGYSLARPSCVGEETYIRNMIAGKRFFRKLFNIDKIQCLFNADTAAGHSQLPQICDLGGQKYYHFQRPEGLLNKKGVPTQFWWKGLDGTEILTSRGIYGGLFVQNEWLLKNPKTDWQEMRQAFFDTALSDKVTELLPTDIVAQFVGCDDCRPLHDLHDQPIKLNEFIEQWNSREKVRIGYADLNEFFEELEAKEVPTFDGPLDHAELTYNFPMKGNLSMWRMRIVLDRLITRIEKLAVIASTLGFSYPQAELDSLWYDLFEITGHAIEFSQAKDNDALYTIAQSAHYRGICLAQKCVAFICNAVKQETELQAVLINTLNWEAEQVVKFQVSNYCGISGFDVIDLHGNKLEYQVADHFIDYRQYKGSEAAGVEILVKAKIPAMGYTSLKIVQNGQSLQPVMDATFIDNLPSGLPDDAENEVVFHNDALEVTFLKGQILSIRDLSTGNILHSEAYAPISFLRFFKYHPESSWLTNFTPVAVYDFTAEHAKVLSNGPIRFTYKTFGKLAGQDAAVTMSMDKGSRGIDMMIETNFSDAIEGMVVYGFKTDKDSEVYADIPFGTEKREFFDHITLDPITNEPIAVAPVEWEFPGQIYARNWCSFHTAKMPVAIISHDCNVYYNYEREKNEIMQILNRHMPLKTRTDRWVGECPESLDGTGKNSYSFSFFLSEKLGKSSDIQRYHKEKKYPADAALKFGFDNGWAALTQEMFSTNRQNIIVSAIYKENDKTYARFFECDGVETTAIISLPAGVKNIRAVDFEGNPRREVDVHFNSICNTAEITFSSYKIVTLELC